MTSISKNVYIDKFDDIINRYNNTKHRTIKIKPIDVKDILTLVKKLIHIGNTYMTLVKKLMIMILNLKLVIM